MIIKHIDIDPYDAAALLFAVAKSEPVALDCNNWPEVAPYKPGVVLRAFHTGSDLVLRFDVLEKCTAAREVNFGGDVYKDSCVEFFIDPDGEGRRYYNFESSCIGVMHNAYHELPGFKVPATEELYEQVLAYTSVGYEPFDEIVAGEHRHHCCHHHDEEGGEEHHCCHHHDEEGGEEHHCCHHHDEEEGEEHHCCHHDEEGGEEHHCCHHDDEGGEEHHCCCHDQGPADPNNYWHITLVIPITALFMDKYESWSELKNARCNFYKCGDGLSKPHYLSWAPVRTEKPNFHSPQFFGEVEFEK